MNTDGFPMANGVARFLDGDVFYSFKHSPLTIIAASITFICIFAAVLAPWIAPHNPFDLKTLNLLDAFTPPASSEKASPGYFLGTHDQGRDGLARVALPKELHDRLAVYVLILAIAASGWVRYARTVRGSTLVERNKEYVQAARVIGRHPLAIMFTHVLPNALGPVLVLVTLHIGEAIITESILSFLGVGVPPTQPSLGTLIRIGNDFLFSGEWWITVFPGAALVILVLAINVLGD